MRLFLAVDPDEAARAALAERLAGWRTALAGFVLESWPYSPHITLARVRDRARGRAHGLAGAAAGLDASPVRWRVVGVTLLSSDLSGPAPRYSQVLTIRLAIE